MYWGKSKGLTQVSTKPEQDQLAHPRKSVQFQLANIVLRVKILLLPAEHGVFPVLHDHPGRRFSNSIQIT